jgi:hypothetical protein
MRNAYKILVRNLLEKLPMIDGAWMNLSLFFWDWYSSSLNISGSDTMALLLLLLLLFEEVVVVVIVVVTAP